MPTKAKEPNLPWILAKKKIGSCLSHGVLVQSEHKKFQPGFKLNPIFHTVNNNATTEILNLF